MSLASSVLPLYAKTLQAHKTKAFTAWPQSSGSVGGYQQERQGFIITSLGKEKRRFGKGIREDV